MTVFIRKRIMANDHREEPGKGVAFWESVKKSEKGPDYKGFVNLEMDYRAGEKLKLAFWLKNTSNGYTLLSIKEDNYSKKMEAQKDEPKEVKPRVYSATPPGRVQPPRRTDIDDGDIPF